MTIEQLNALSDYEINCAVAIKENPDLGHAMDEQVTETTGSAVNFRLSTPTGDCCDAGTYDYCNNPSDYMPIAIEHGISINFDGVDPNEFDKGIDWVSCSYRGSECDMNFYPRKNTGKAVCIAFLLMNGESND